MFRHLKAIQSYTGSHRVVATVNGTALHVPVLGVCSGDMVITQPLTFVAM